MASAFLLYPVSVLAGGAGPDWTMAEEYYLMEKGQWPKEVTFSDTVFTRAVHTPTYSVLKSLNGTETDGHTFTIKAGDRVNFSLQGSPYGLINAQSESLTSWNSPRFYYRFPGIVSDGLYITRRNAESYEMEITDFGFDTDLSDLSAHVVLKISLDAKEVYQDAAIPPQMTGEEYAAFLEEYKDDSQFKDKVEITAEGNAHISPVNRTNPSVYLADPGDVLQSGKSDSVGFQFILEDDASWTMTLNGTPCTPEQISFDYSIVWEDYESNDVLNQLQLSETMYYKTLSIVLVDSDLVDRNSTVVDQYLQEQNEPKNTPSPNPENSRGENSRPLITRRAEAIPALAGLAVLSVGSAAALSFAASSGASAAHRKEEEEENRQENGEASIIVNENEDLPSLLAGSDVMLSVPAVLETDLEGPWTWNALVITDQKQKETLPGISAVITGSGTSASLAVRAADTGFDYGAVIRVTADSADPKIHAEKIINVNILAPGLRITHSESGTLVTFRTKGSIPGSAEETSLHPDEYKKEILPDGRILYRYQEYTAKAEEDA